MNRKLITAAAVGFFAASAAANAAVSTCAVDSDNRAIAESYQSRWLDALNDRDTSRLSALYAESAVLMPPSDETIVGRAPISEYLHASPGPAVRAQYSVDLVSCEVRGTALHVAGVWGARAENGSGVLATGNLLRVLEPGEDGRWVVRYEIWN